jgi:glycosyltransferase involved in cell wall biosynthesis
VGGDAISLQKLNSWVHSSQDLIDAHLLTIIVVFDEKKSILSDKNFAELEKWRDKIKLISGVFNGPALARNAGLAEVNSQWVVFADCDDIVYPHYVIEEISHVGEENDLIIGQFSMENLNDGVEYPFENLGTWELMDLAKRPGIWRMAFRSASIRKVRFPDVTMGEDQLFLMSYLAENEKVIFVQSIFYRYHIGGEGQLTSNRNALQDLQKTVLLSKKIMNSATSNKDILSLMYLLQLNSKFKYVDGLQMPKRAILLFSNLTAIKINFHHRLKISAALVELGLKK